VRAHATREGYMKLITDIVITVFGLNHARNTPVGDAVIRGVSGGEKKRVSIAEALASRSCITSWDKSVIPLILPIHVPKTLSAFFKARPEVSTPARLLNSFALCVSLRTRSN
jgi:hypothetical protein